MKTATALLLLLVTGCAMPYAPQEFDFSEMLEHRRALEEAFMHPINREEREFRL